MSKYVSVFEGIMHDPEGTYFGKLHGLHNIIVIITLNVYFIVIQSEKTPSHMIFQRPSFTGILNGLAFKMRSHIISTL